jgi:hypothetical protein
VVTICQRYLKFLVVRPYLLWWASIVSSKQLYHKAIKLSPYAIGLFIVLVPEFGINGKHPTVHKPSTV